MSMTLDSAYTLLAGVTSVSQSSANSASGAEQGEKAVSNPAYTISLSSAATEGARSAGALDTLYNARGATTNTSGQALPQFQASIDADVSAIENLLNGEYGQQLDDLLNK